MRSLTSPVLELVSLNKDILRLSGEFHQQAAGLPPDLQAARVLEIIGKFNELTALDEQAGHVVSGETYLGLSGELGRLARYLS